MIDDGVRSVERTQIRIRVRECNERREEGVKRRPHCESGHAGAACNSGLGARQPRQG